MAGSALIGNLAVNLSLETAAFQSGANIVEKRAQALGRRMQGIGENMTRVGAVMSVGITAPFVALMSKAIPAAIESRQALGQVEAALKSMGGASGKTAGELQKSAAQLQRISTFDDDEILREVTANLLTFGNVAGTQFDRAQLAAVNLATRMKMDLQPATILIGKALNDPIKGLTAMGRAGIQFTESQKEMIKGMVETGDLAGAQNIILKELERQFGGSAKAMRDATPGADTQEQWRTFQEAIGELALKVLPPLTNLLTKVLETFNSLSPSTQAWVAGAVALAAAIGPVLLVLGPLVTLVGSLLPLIVKLGPLLGLLGPVLGVVGKALLFIAGNPLILGLAIVIGGIYLAWKNWDKIEPIIRAVYNAVKTWLMDKLSAVIDWVKGKIQSIGDKFKWLYNVVVGHSYIPDMVEGIGRSMAELQKLMVDPALSATEKVAGAFQQLGSIVGDLFGHKAGSIISSLGQLAMALGPLFGGGGSGAMFSAGEAASKVKGMASGGSGVFGGRSGVDRNLLSLNGSPIARVSRGEHFSVGNDNAMTARVTIVPTPYFDAVVDNRAVRVAAPMAGQAAIMGATGGVTGIQRRAARTLP